MGYVTSLGPDQTVLVADLKHANRGARPRIEGFSALTLGNAGGQEAQKLTDLTIIAESYHHFVALGGIAEICPNLVKLKLECQHVISVGEVAKLKLLEILDISGSAAIRNFDPLFASSTTAPALKRLICRNTPADVLDKLISKKPNLKVDLEFVSGENPYKAKYDPQKKKWLVNVKVQGGTEQTIELDRLADVTSQIGKLRTKFGEGDRRTVDLNAIGPTRQDFNNAFGAKFIPANIRDLTIILKEGYSEFAKEEKDRVADKVHMMLTVKSAEIVRIKLSAHDPRTLVIYKNTSVKLEYQPDPNVEAQITPINIDLRNNSAAFRDYLYQLDVNEAINTVTLTVVDKERMEQAKLKAVAAPVLPVTVGDDTATVRVATGEPVTINMYLTLEPSKWFAEFNKVPLGADVILLADGKPLVEEDKQKKKIDWRHESVEMIGARAARLFAERKASTVVVSTVLNVGDDDIDATFYNDGNVTLQKTGKTTASWKFVSPADYANIDFRKLIAAYKAKTNEACQITLEDITAATLPKVITHDVDISTKRWSVGELAASFREVNESVRIILGKECTTKDATALSAVINNLLVRQNMPIKKVAVVISNDDAEPLFVVENKSGSSQRADYIIAGVACNTWNLRGSNVIKLPELIEQLGRKIDTDAQLTKPEAVLKTSVVDVSAKDWTLSGLAGAFSGSAGTVTVIVGKDLLRKETDKLSDVINAALVRPINPIKKVEIKIAAGDAEPLVTIENAGGEHANFTAAGKTEASWKLKGDTANPLDFRAIVNQAGRYAEVEVKTTVDISATVWDVSNLNRLFRETADSVTIIVGKDLLAKDSAKLSDIITPLLTRKNSVQKVEIKISAEDQVPLLVIENTSGKAADYTIAGQQTIKEAWHLKGNNELNFKIILQRAGRDSEIAAYQAEKLLAATRTLSTNDASPGFTDSKLASISDISQSSDLSGVLVSIPEVAVGAGQSAAGYIQPIATVDSLRADATASLEITSLASTNLHLAELTASNIAFDSPVSDGNIRAGAIGFANVDSTNITAGGLTIPSQSAETNLVESGLVVVDAAGANLIGPDQFTSADVGVLGFAQSASYAYEGGVAANIEMPESPVGEAATSPLGELGIMFARIAHYTNQIHLLGAGFSPASGSQIDVITSNDVQRGTLNADGSATGAASSAPAAVPGQHTVMPPPPGSANPADLPKGTEPPETTLIISAADLLSSKTTFEAYTESLRERISAIVRNEVNEKAINDALEVINKKGRGRWGFTDEEKLKIRSATTLLGAVGKATEKAVQGTEEPEPLLLNKTHLVVTGAHAHELLAVLAKVELQIGSAEGYEYDLDLAKELASKKQHQPAETSKPAELPSNATKIPKLQHVIFRNVVGKFGSEQFYSVAVSAWPSYSAEKKPETIVELQVPITVEFDVQAGKQANPKIVKFTFTPKLPNSIVVTTENSGKLPLNIKLNKAGDILNIDFDKLASRYVANKYYLTPKRLIECGAPDQRKFVKPAVPATSAAASTSDASTSPSRKVSKGLISALVGAVALLVSALVVMFSGQKEEPQETAQNNSPDTTDTRTATPVTEEGTPDKTSEPAPVVVAPDKTAASVDLLPPLGSIPSGAEQGATVPTANPGAVAQTPANDNKKTYTKQDVIAALNKANNVLDKADLVSAVEESLLDGETYNISQLRTALKTGGTDPVYRGTILGVVDGNKSRERQ